MSSTRLLVESRIAKQRAEDARQADLRRAVVENNILAGHGKSAARVEGLRRCRSEANVRREMFHDYSFVKGEQDKQRRLQISQFEENIADELARRKAEDLRVEVHRRRVCDGSEELRALKERLHMAKVNKERAQQLLEIEVRREKDRHLDQHMAEHMENQRLEHVELELKLNAEKQRQRERVKLINQQQIATKEAQREEAQREYQRERHEVAELVAKVEQEDAQEVAAREEKRLETKQMLNDFIIEQKVRQQQMEEQERQESEKIEQYARDKAAREEALAKEKERQEREKERIFLSMIKKAEARNKEAEELDYLRNELHFQELEAQARRNEALQMRKKLEDREEMKNAYCHQMALKEEKARVMKAEEDKLKDIMMAKFAEDDRIEQMSEQRRRMKVEQHKREAERLVQLKREMYDAARDLERQEASRLREEEGDRALIIEQERQRLLQEHAVGLKDFLPKSTLETQEDHDWLFGRRAARSASA